jgi:N-acetylglutamate synthase/N-acetylornithine aminotransferase
MKIFTKNYTTYSVIVRTHNIKKVHVKIYVITSSYANVCTNEHGNKYSLWVSKHRSTSA